MTTHSMEVVCAHIEDPHRGKTGSTNTTPVGFEPTRGDPIGLAGRRLNRSAKVSLELWVLEWVPSKWPWRLLSR